MRVEPQNAYNIKRKQKKKKKNTYNIRKKQIKEKKGITLIALIITIIVILILAVVSFNLAVGNNGIITKTQWAVEADKQGKALEEITLAWGAFQVDWQLVWANNKTVEFSSFVLT